MTEVKKVSTPRIVGAFLLYFITAFVIGGYLVAKVTGNTTEGGFQLNGVPALISFALIVVYFVAARYLGGTIWQRILKARRK